MFLNSRVFRFSEIVIDTPDYLEDHGLHVGPASDFGDAFYPMLDEGGGSLASGFAQFEAGPSESGVMSVLSSHMLGDGGDGEHGVKSSPIYSGYLMDGLIGRGIVRAIDDHSPLSTWKAGIAAHGNEALLVIFCVFDPMREG